MVLFQVDFAGVCHSDVHIAKGAFPGYPLPRIMGKSLRRESSLHSARCQSVRPHKCCSGMYYQHKQIILVTWQKPGILIAFCVYFAIIDVISGTL